MAKLTTSQYYSPCLNGAIFDGPFKIYFSQDQESLGLKVYMQLKEKLGELYKDVKEQYRDSGFNIFVMIYPTPEVFQSMSQSTDISTGFFEGKVKENLLVGVSHEMTDQQFDFLYTYLFEKVSTTAASPILREVPLSPL